MSNRITEKYFDKRGFIEKEKEILEEIKNKTGFIFEKEIFRGEIYDKDKVGSLLYQGRWQNKPAVLKVQGLKLEIDEVDIINTFNKQNKSEKVRLPELYDSLKWNKQNGYGYLLMEFVGAPMIYNPPFADLEQIKDFCGFYEKYKTKAINKPFFPQAVYEQSSLVFTVQRVSHWAKIAESKNTLTESDIKNLEKFLSLIGKHLPSVKMEFMHGHLTYSDVLKASNNEYVLMSNLFWSYRPEYYDTVFHLWAGVKSIRDLSVTLGQVIQYLQNWIEEYKKLSLIKNDPDFERKFNLMMAERCIGALLVDLRNQSYHKDKDNHIAHLTGLFRDLLNYFFSKI